MHQYQRIIAFVIALTYTWPEANIVATEPVRKQNLRRSRRGAARGNLKLQCRKGALGLGPNLAASVLDVSDSGARLVLTQSLEISTEVEIIVIGYGMKGTIKRLGNVRWQVKLESGQFCVGIEFQKSLKYIDWQMIVVPS